MTPRQPESATKKGTGRSGFALEQQIPVYFQRSLPRNLLDLPADSAKELKSDASCHL